MAILIKDDTGLPKPQYQTEDGTRFEPLLGRDGASYVRIKDGHNATLGAISDMEAATGDGSVIALLKRFRTILDNIFMLQYGGIEFQWKFASAVTNNYLDIELPPDPQKRHCLSLITISFTGNITTRPGIYVKDGNNLVFRHHVNDSIILPFSPPLIGTLNSRMLISLDPSGDDSITASVSALGFDLPSL